VPHASHPDFEDSICVVSDCIHVAAAISSAHVVLPPNIGMPDGYEYLTLDIPVCVDHQRTLRLGVRDWQLST
jgi:hypothetical protein